MSISSSNIRILPYRDSDETIKHMGTLVRGLRGEQSWVLRELVEEVVREITPKDKCSHISALYYWFLQHYTYVYDPIEVEQVKDPQRLAEEIRQYGKAIGDCDDAAVFLVAAYRSLGIQATFSRVGFNAEEEGLTHVFVVAQDQFGRVIVVDPVAKEITKKMLGEIKRVKV